MSHRRLVASGAVLAAVLVILAGCSGPAEKPAPQAPAPSAAAPAAAGIMTFGYPEVRFPHYYLAYTFPKSELKPFTLKRIEVGGEEVRDVLAAGLDDPTLPDKGYKYRYAPYGKKVRGDVDFGLTVRCEWVPGRPYNLTVKGVDEAGAEVLLEASGTPAAGPGYWNAGWKDCAAIILRESAGDARVQEPVHIKLALYSDRLTDPAREIRVVDFDPARLGSPDGPYREVPSQVYDLHVWNDPKLINADERVEETGERIVRYLPTTTLKVAFFADVAAHGEKIYLLFYGNPAAPAPSYATDLKVSEPGIGQVVENDFLRVDLDDSSGAVFGVFIKQGKDALLEHKLETNGAVHWNPGAYSPPHAWVHASDWKSPKFEQVTGPVFHMTKRWAPLPSRDDIMVTITYLFYAGKPYMISSSLTDVLEEFYCQALRNGEIVFNHEKLDEFAYQALDGKIHEHPIATALKHPEHVVDIPYDVPWVAFTNEATGIGFASITLELANTNRFGGNSDAEQPYYYVANGPWIYFSRGLNYSFGSNNPTRMIHAAKGSLYHEKSAYLGFVLGATEADKYRMIGETEAQLRRPLTASYYLATDTRNNAGWVTPVLTEPFDEGVAGSVAGGATAGKKK